MKTQAMPGQSKDFSAENARLQEQVAQLEAELEGHRRRSDLFQSIASYTGLALWRFLVLGSELDNILRKIFRELSQGVRPSPDDLASLTAAVFRRFTRIGLFAMAAAVLPSALLVWQNLLISTQNEYLRTSNDFVIRQISEERRRIQWRALYDAIDAANEVLNQAERCRPGYSKVKDEDKLPLIPHPCKDPVESSRAILAKLVLHNPEFVEYYPSLHRTASELFLYVSTLRNEMPNSLTEENLLERVEMWSKLDGLTKMFVEKIAVEQNALSSVASHGPK